MENSAKKFLVYIHVYQKFYVLLSERFFNDYIKNLPYSGQPGDRSMWERKIKDINGELYLPSIPLFGAKSYEYFYRRKLDAEKLGYCNLEFPVFIKALAYLGYKTNLDKKSVRQLPEKEICRNLFSQFLTDNNLIEEPLALEQTKHVVEVIKKFYTGISYKLDLKSSWEILSPEFRQSWVGGYSEFEKGYTNTKTIRNLCIFNVTQVSPSEVECLVYYDDEINAYSSVELSGLRSLSVRDINKFVSHVEEMRAQARDFNIKKFEDIELHRLFDPVASEYIWSKCKFNEEQFRFFSAKNRVVVKRLYQCCCILIERKWYIYSLRMLPTYSTR
ncbi:MAG: hypothetical protein U0X91_00495 [Spirosomataceae bacterium]